MSRFATCILAVLCCFAAFGETVTDSVKVYFRLNQAIISPNVGENAVLMDSFVNRVAALNAAGDLMSVSISGHASPEGPLKLNERLALKRGEALATELIKYATIDPRIITIKPGGIAWSDLCHLVLASDELADHREAILQILDIPDLNSAERLSRLKQVDNGKSYTIMFNNLFPQLRYTKAVAYFHRQPDTLVTDIDVSVDTITNSPFIANQDSLVAESKPNIDFTPPPIRNYRIMRMLRKMT